MTQIKKLESLIAKVTNLQVDTPPRINDWLQSAKVALLQALFEAKKTVKIEDFTAIFPEERKENAYKKGELIYVRFQQNTIGSVYKLRNGWVANSFLMIHLNKEQIRPRKTPQDAAKSMWGSVCGDYAADAITTLLEADSC